MDNVGPEVNYQLIATVNGERVHHSNSIMVETVEQELYHAEKAVDAKLDTLLEEEYETVVPKRTRLEEDLAFIETFNPKRAS